MACSLPRTKPSTGRRSGGRNPLSEIASNDVVLGHGHWSWLPVRMPSEDSLCSGGACAARTGVTGLQQDPGWGAIDGAVSSSHEAGHLCIE